MTTPPLRQLLIRKFMTATIGGPSVLVAQDAEAAADTALSVVGPYVEALAAEVELLRATAKSGSEGGAGHG